MDFREAPQTCTVSCLGLCKEDYVMLKGRSCKIVDIWNSKDKIHFVGVDVFTGKRLHESFPTSANVQVPNVTMEDYKVKSQSLN